MATVASLVINLTASTSQLEKGFLQATRLTDRFVKSTKSVTRQLDEIARYGRNAGLALTAMSLSVRKLVKASADHEESMLRVKAVARATVQEYHALSAAALQASTTTRHSLSSIGEGMKFLAMAGFQAKEITEMIPVVTRMATAGAVDMVTAADITTNILAGYGMAVEDLSKATDVLVAAFTGANVTLQLLGETFKHVGPVAKSAGMEFEEIAAAAALLGNAGIQGSIAGTSLKSAISRLVSPSNTAARILKRLGVETTTSEGKLRNLADIIDDLSKAGATTADVLRIFGLRAGPSMARLLDVGADALRQYTQRLRDSEGWAELIEAEQMQSFNAQLDLTKNIIHAFSVELGDVLLPYMKTLNWLIGDLVDGWRNLDDATKDNVIRIAVVGGAILSFITVLGLVAGAISMVIKGFTTLGIILGLVTSGPVLTILGIALAIGYLKKAWDENLGGIQDKTKTVLDTIKGYWARFMTWWEGTPAVTPEGLTSGFDSDQPGFKHKLLAMKQFLAEKWEWVIDIGGRAWKWITETTLEEKLEDTKRWLKEGWEWVIDLGGDAWDWFLDDTKLGNTIKRAWGWIEQWWHGVPAVTPEGLTSGFDYDQPGFKHKLMDIKHTFIRTWSEIQSKITALHEQFQEKWEWIVYLAGDAWPWLTETTWAEKWEDIKGWLTSGWDWLVDIAGSAWSWLTETTWTEKVEDVKGWLTSGWDWLVDIAGSAWSWLTETTWTEKVEDVKGWLSEAWDWTMNLAGNAWAWIEENLPWLADALTDVKSLIADHWEWVVDTVGSAWDWFSNSEAVNELIGRLDALKARITDSEAWKWTVDVGLPAVLEAGEMVIKVVVELGGETYDAIKTGFETGDWGPLFGIASDLWSKGALIWLGFEIADTTFEIVKKKIIKGLGLSGVTGGLVGTGLVIGVATIGIQLAEAWAKGDYENFMRNIVAASIAAVFGGTIGGPAGAIVTFDIVLNLKLGEKIEGWMEAWSEFLGVPPEHEKLLKEYEQYRQALIDEATKDMNWLQKLWWQLTGNQPEGLLSFPEWKQARGLDSLEVEVEPIPVGYVDDFKGLIRQIASSPEFDDLRAKLSEWNIVLEDFLVKLAQSESGLKDIVNWAGARGEFQMMPESMKAVEEALGTSLNWDDATERAFGSIVWFRMGVESEFDTIVAAAERLGVTLEEALKLWWVAGGGNLSKLYNLDAVAWTEPSGRKVTYRDILNAWRGYSEGTPWTGWGALDEPAGIVHKREAVIPWKVLRKGPLSVLEFLGMRGFQEGRIPSMPGVSQARETLSWMQDIFNDIADVLLEGLATLFEYIIRAVEIIALALVGEEKVEKIKAEFQSLYDGITDLIQKMKVTTPPEPEKEEEEKVVIKWWQEWLAGLEAAMEEFDWTSPINTFVNTLANGLAQAESYMAQFAGEMVRLIKLVVQKTEDGTAQIVLDFDYMIAQMANSLATMIAESLVNFLSGYDIPQQRKDPFPNLTELLDNLENYEKNQKRLKQLKAAPDLATIGGGGLGAGIGFAVGGPLGALIGGFLGALAGRKSAQAATKREIEELTEKLKTDFLAIKEMLGTTMQDVANGLARAFSAETYEDFVNQFSQNLESQVKNALITAFMASDVVRPLIDELSNQISLAVMDGMLDANERDSILGLYDQIVSVSGDFFNSLQELGIATGDVADGMKELSGAMRNVPQGLKIVSNRLAAAGYSVPGLHNLAYEEPNDRVTEEKVEIHIHGSIYGVDELKRVIKTTVAETQRRVSLATNGVG